MTRYRLTVEFDVADDSDCPSEWDWEKIFGEHQSSFDDDTTAVDYDTIRVDKFLGWKKVL